VPLYEIFTITIYTVNWYQHLKCLILWTVCEGSFFFWNALVFLWSIILLLPLKCRHNVNYLYQWSWITITVIIGNIDTILSMNIINLLINCYYNIFILGDMYLFGRKSIIRWRNFGKAKYLINSCHFITYFIKLFKTFSQFSLVHRT